MSAQIISPFKESVVCNVEFLESVMYSGHKSFYQIHVLQRVSKGTACYFILLAMSLRVKMLILTKFSVSTCFLVWIVIQCQVSETFA